MRRVALITALVAAGLIGLAGCGEDGSGAQEPGQAQQVEITFEGDHVTPSGKRIEVEHGEPLDLVVKADQPGELHVHSTPEQELEYGKGTTTLTLRIDQPGVVDVESHDLDVVVLQLEVS